MPSTQSTFSLQMQPIQLVAHVIQVMFVNIQAPNCANPVLTPVKTQMLHNCHDIQPIPRDSSINNPIITTKSAHIPKIFAI